MPNADLNVGKKSYKERERHLLASICASRSLKPRKQNSRKVKRLFIGFQTNFVDVLTNMAKYGTEVADRSRDSGRRSRDRRSTVKRGCFNVSRLFQRFKHSSEKRKVTFEKSRAERSGDRGRRSRFKRPSADTSNSVFYVSNNFFGRFNQLGIIFREKSLNGHATVTWSEDTRPTADCRATFFEPFKQFGKILKKIHWTVTRLWSEVTRPSADCQTTFFPVGEVTWSIFKKGNLFPS